MRYGFIPNPDMLFFISPYIILITVPKPNGLNFVWCYYIDTSTTRCLSKQKLNHLNKRCSPKAYIKMLTVLMNVFFYIAPIFTIFRSGFTEALAWVAGRWYVSPIQCYWTRLEWDCQKFRDCCGGNTRSFGHDLSAKKLEIKVEWAVSK